LIAPREYEQGWNIRRVSSLEELLEFAGTVRERVDTLTRALAGGSFLALAPRAMLSHLDSDGGVG
jgi:hypothetical protein